MANITDLMIIGFGFSLILTLGLTAYYQSQGLETADVTASNIVGEWLGTHTKYTNTTYAVKTGICTPEQKALGCTDEFLGGTQDYTIYEPILGLFSLGLYIVRLVTLFGMVLFPVTLYYVYIANIITNPILSAILQIVFWLYQVVILVSIVKWLVKPDRWET